MNNTASLYRKGGSCLYVGKSGFVCQAASKSRYPHTFVKYLGSSSNNWYYRECANFKPLSSLILYSTVGLKDNHQRSNMKVAIVLAVVFCLAVHAADISGDFPQPPYNIIHPVNDGTITSLTCPDNCGNPRSKYCLWNADIQDTCSATYEEKRAVEEKRQGGCAQFGACGPVCYSNGQGGYACGCVSCGK
ncbi:hypothetical protein PROFUN_06043 [Planoprotostelium fungivorum]|uniref:Uncharacterized protein n=1 Tax=Planoprotostelium fungivorum TaxID=1890364 RepID=A0A2P6NPN6_9EUKA|nr:hypothetical protein PROFUN_06043 [Planoprotostelium fungivorum]